MRKNTQLSSTLKDAIPLDGEVWLVQIKICGLFNNGERWRLSLKLEGWMLACLQAPKVMLVGSEF
jgi:hypothetical protein